MGQGALRGAGCWLLSGTIPVSKEALNRTSRGLDITVFKILRIVTGALKGPVPLLDFSLVISVSISSAVVGEIKKLLQEGVFKYSKGDISTFDIKQARSFPVLAKHY